MSRPLGGYIGHRPVPATAGFNSAAGGVWTLTEAQRFKQAGTWPIFAAVPQTIGGLQLWLDASDTSTLFDATTGGSLVATDAVVARWQDKSGNANHCTASSDGPQRKASRINGRDALTFNGTSNFLQGSATPTSGSVRTVFVVAKSATSAGQEIVQIGIAPASGAFRGFLLRQRYIGSDSFVGGDVTTNNLSIASTQLPITTTFVACIVQASLASNQYFHNSTSYSVTGTLTAGGGFSADPGYLIGTARSSGGASLGYWSGDVCEIIVYDTALSTVNRSAVESYLIGKWGIS